jgi:tetratricopeptide (TPR) repeat protein
MAQLHNGLDLLSALPEGAARQEQELTLQMTLGYALMATKGHSAPEPGEAYARARQLCEQLNRPQQLGLVLLGQHAFRMARGELEQAGHFAEEIRHLGEARNDVYWKRAGSNASGLSCFSLGKFIDARAYYENALSLRNPMHREWARRPDWAWPDARLETGYLSRTLLYLGYADQARLRMDEVLAKARQRSPFGLGLALFGIWHLYWAFEGPQAIPTVLRSAEEVLAISTERGFNQQFGLGNIIRGWCLGAMGQAVEGIPSLRRGIAIWRTTGAKLEMPFYLMTLAEVYGMAGQPDEGLDRLAEAANLVETTQERWAEAEMHRLRGTLLLAMNEHAAAENSYRHALAVAQRQSAKFWELRAATSLARLWRDQGKRTEARDLLAPIYGWFTEGFETPVLQDAKALLDQLA